MHIRWRGLELPSAVTCEAATLTATYGKFIAEPFERGFGSTIGNGLRRVLLSSLEGSAVTQIKVHNAQHEFTTIKGVLEDLTDIVLNVKGVGLRMSYSYQGNTYYMDSTSFGFSSYTVTASSWMTRSSGGCRSWPARP